MNTDTIHPHLTYRHEVRMRIMPASHKLLALSLMAREIARDQHAWWNTHTHTIFAFPTPFAFGLSSGAVAVLFKGGLFEVVVAALIGACIGLLSIATAKRPNLAAAHEALSALFAGIVACAVHAYLMPLQVTTVIVSTAGF